MGTKKSFLLLLAALFVFGSCMRREFIKGRAELISTSDTLISDSCVFEGYVFPLDYVGDYPYWAVPFEVWIENTQFRTATDSTGYYIIKTIPGTHILRSQTQGNTWEPLIEEKREVKIEENQKIRIDFYIGYAIE